MLKYLRIAVTALGLTACVLMITLWVRSYWWMDIAKGALSENRAMTIRSERGRVSAEMYSNRSNFRWPWTVTSNEISEIEQSERIVAMSTLGLQGPIRHTNFALRTQKNGSYVVAPIWLPLLFSAMFTVIYGFHYSSHFRFSLRTLLIATTLVAVVMGLIVVSR